jgi:hypothetical protein
LGGAGQPRNGRMEKPCCHPRARTMRTKKIHGGNFRRGSVRENRVSGKKLFVVVVAVASVRRAA